MDESWEMDESVKGSIFVEESVEEIWGGWLCEWVGESPEAIVFVEDFRRESRAHGREIRLEENGPSGKMDWEQMGWEWEPPCCDVVGGPGVHGVGDFEKVFAWQETKYTQKRKIGRSMKLSQMEFYHLIIWWVYDL